jgi:hypothetical protein
MAAMVTITGMSIAFEDKFMIGLIPPTVLFMHADKTPK